MRIKSLVFENWLCFGGHQTIHLEAKAYALIARHARNKERSNWLGKSAALEAIRFAITGWHRHRTEDDWITDNEKAGAVHLILENNTSISRTRKRGQSTRLDVSGATREEAQDHIYQLLGLTERDFMATSYFEQGQMSRFITQDSAERTQIVTGWFRLDPLMAAEDIHKTHLATLTWNATTTREQLRATEELERAELAGFESFEALMQAKTKLETDVKNSRDALEKAQRSVEASNRIAVNDERKQRLQTIIDEGLKLKAIVEKIDGEKLIADRERAHDLLQRTASERSASARDVMQKRQLAMGNFDGRCPVAGIDCPAKNDINKRQTQNSKLHAQASETLDANTVAETDARKAYEKIDANKQAFDRGIERLNTLREQGESLSASIDDELPSNKTDVKETANTLTVRLQDQIGKLAVYERSLAAIEKARGERLRLAKLLSTLESAITTEREAKAIVGRNGAQRRIAESGLKEIEDGANSMLSECGIDLSVAMRWSREGTTIASACEECGHPFPKSARAKICERCESPRGMNIINKLEPVLSNTSGAAKDLAGAAFQLAASAWMRANRGARWSVAELDEPFGQLDPANRKAFSTHLATLLRSRYGFEQSFTVAHHAGVLDALPGRIEIEGDGKRSTIKVIT